MQTSRISIHSSQITNHKSAPLDDGSRVQQDAFLEQKPDDNSIVPIAAVFDGHGRNGHHLSQASADCLAAIRIPNSQLNSLETQLKGLPKLLESKVKEILQHKIKTSKFIGLYGLGRTKDHFILDSNSDFKELDQRETKVYASSGCTMTAVFLQTVPFHRFWVVNLGDSRAAFYDPSGCPLHVFEPTATVCTIDHAFGKGPPNELKPGQTEQWWWDETKRIKALGGEVRKPLERSIYRTNGIMAISRGLFDDDVSLDKEPDVYRVPFLTGFMIVASDGVWDVLSIEEVGLLLVDPFAFLMDKTDLAPPREMLHELGRPADRAYSPVHFVQALDSAVAAFQYFQSSDWTELPQWQDFGKAAEFIVNIARIMGSADDCTLQIIKIDD